MPTRKQKRREAKSKRHDYEIVYLDDDGNEVEPPPEEPARNGAKPTARSRHRPLRARSRRRAPLPPSWQRAGKRAVLLGIVVFFLFGMLNKNHNYAGAALAAVIYTLLFIPFTYTLDRFAYRRCTARDQSSTEALTPLDSPNGSCRRHVRARSAADELLRRARGAWRGGSRRRRSRWRRGPAAARARRNERLLRGHPDHARPLRPRRRSRRSRRGDGRTRVHARGRARAARALSGVRARGRSGPCVSRRPPPAGRRDARCSPASSSSASRSPATRLRTSRSTPTAACSAATCSSPARSAASTCPAPTGTRCSPRSARCIERFPEDTIVYPGHGPRTTLGAELARNPFLAELRA